MVHIISVSIDNKQAEWLQTQKGRKDCSPTFLLRRAIHEKMQEMGDEYFEDIKSMRAKVERFAARFQKTLDFAERKGVKDELLEEIQ